MTRLLIVDGDLPHAQTLARAFLRLRPDLTVLTASNGVEASALMAERSVDLVLTELQMPEMDGFELVAWIVGNRPDIPVFTMSAFSREGTAERLSALGACEYFAKPIEPKSALARLTDTLNQSVRGHVQNVSLASFLQLMEMERKTCNLAISCDEKSGILVLRKGQLVDAQSGALCGEEAAIAIIAWPNPNIMISKGGEVGGRTIEKPLGFIVMEAMRVQDEAARSAADGTRSSFPPQRRSWRPIPPSYEPGSAKAVPLNGATQVDLALPTGARALAIVDAQSGAVLCSSVKEGCPLEELARMAALVLQQETKTLGLCDLSEGIEELVLSTREHCDVIRPLADHAEFALIVFAPEETNLVMARLELTQFVAKYR